MISEGIYTLAQIRKTLNDGFPHCAQYELQRWMNENGITVSAAKLENDIGNVIRTDRAEWDEFLSGMEAL
jgi:hypothetical protein